MLLRNDTFRRLCQARDLLAEAGPSAGDDPLSIRGVARQVCISPYHFIRQFEALFGVTPHQFRIEVRIDQAKQLLALDRMPVTDICLEVGMSSLGSFSDLFARRVGVPPSDYRRRARLLVQVPANYPLSMFPGCLTLMGNLPDFAFRNFQEATKTQPPLELP